MLISYKNVSMREVLNKTLYTIMVYANDEWFELGVTGLVASDTESTCGNRMEDIFVFEDVENAVIFAKKYLKYYNDKATIHYIDISQVLVVPIKANEDDISKNELDKELDSFDEIMLEDDVANAIEVEL